MSHSFQGLLESAIESLGDTTSSLGQAYAKLEKSRSDFPRLTKLGKCRQKYTLTTKCSYEESKNWLLLNIQPALDNIIGHLEKQAENLEEEERVLTQSVDVAIKETRREQQNKQSETSEKEQTLNELKTKRRQYSRQIEEMDAEIKTMKDKMMVSFEIVDSEMEEPIEELSQQLQEITEQIETLTNAANNPSLSIDDKIKICTERIKWYTMSDMVKEWMGRSSEFGEAAQSDLSLAKSWQISNQSSGQVKAEFKKHLELVKTSIKIMFAPEVHNIMNDILDAWYDVDSRGFSLEKLRVEGYAESLDQFDTCLELLYKLNLIGNE